MAALPRVLVTIAITIIVAAPSPAAASEKPAEPVVTAVFSNVFNGYQRTRLPDGKFKPETYTFGDGGRRNAGISDASLDNLPFVRIAQTLTGPLAARGYHQGADPKNIDLLIMVYYGCTAGTERGSSSASHLGFGEALNGSRYDRIAPAASSPDGLPTPQSTSESQLEGLLVMVGIENRIRDDQNYRNAQLLGYYDALVATDTIAQYAGQGAYRRDLLSDVEEDRYCVILVACDFRTAQQEKKLRPLWSTRFNVRAHGNTFTLALPSMARFAARYFGQSSGGLVREAVPVGQVEIKDLIDLGEAKGTKK